MPDSNTLKMVGTKIVPINRFNLEAAKPSTSFAATPTNSKNPKPFTVIKHPVLSTFHFEPILTGTYVIIDYCPLMEDNVVINANTQFKDYSYPKINLSFPKIELIPSNNQIFYYENTLDGKGNNIGFIGKVTLKYSIANKPTSTTQQNINLSLKEVILNLKVSSEIIKINGIIDEKQHEIVFNLKNEAVKIAYFNLASDFDDLKSSVDLFFNFKGYSKIKKHFLVAKDWNLMARLNSTISLRKGFLDRPLIIRESRKKKINLNEQIRPGRNPRSFDNKDIAAVEKSGDEKDEFVKNTFLLKINKVLSFPAAKDAASSMFKTIGGGFINNPFNLQKDYSQYEQIFVPGINFDKLSIYKSKMTPNEFLLIAKRYCISRTSDTKSPCFQTIFHAEEEGSGLTEDISKINFQFAIGPDLSEFDLAKLKIDLYNNNFLDGKKSDFINTTRFIFPNEIESEFEISGNYLLQKAEVSTDGKHFLISITSENLNEASILINAINNSISQYANINFRFKEIKDSSVIEINIQKTIGEILAAIADPVSKTISIENLSLSKCKINSVLTIDDYNDSLYNSAFFESYPEIESGETKQISCISLNPNLDYKKLKSAYFDFESIEDISKEFNQIVSTSTTYNRYVQIQIQAQKTEVSRIQIELRVEATDSVFNLEKMKSDFRTPILFNFITLNSDSAKTIILYNVNCFDKDNNIVSTTNYSFDYLNSSIISIPKIEYTKT